MRRPRHSRVTGRNSYNYKQIKELTTISERAIAIFRSIRGGGQAKRHDFPQFFQQLWKSLPQRRQDADCSTGPSALQSTSVFDMPGGLVYHRQFAVENRPQPFRGVARLGRRYRN